MILYKTSKLLHPSQERMRSNVIMYTCCLKSESKKTKKSNQNVITQKYSLQLLPSYLLCLLTVCYYKQCQHVIFYASVTSFSLLCSASLQVMKFSITWNKHILYFGLWGAHIRLYANLWKSQKFLYKKYKWMVSLYKHFHLFWHSLITVYRIKLLHIVFAKLSGI